MQPYRKMVRPSCDADNCEKNEQNIPMNSIFTRTHTHTSCICFDLLQIRRAFPLYVAMLNAFSVCVPFPPPPRPFNPLSITDTLTLHFTESPLSTLFSRSAAIFAGDFRPKILFYIVQRAHTYSILMAFTYSFT